MAGDRYERDIPVNNNYISDIENQNVSTIRKVGDEEKIYSYDEALELTGHGKYHIGLLITLCSAVTSMAMDLFGFSLVVTGAACDLKLEYSHKSTLLTVPLLGPIIMAYPWGYVADTQGRKRALVLALWGSLVTSALSAFSVNWIMLAILKLISSSFSGGIQSISYTLMGELCTDRYKNSYLLFISSTLMAGYCIYTGIGYFAMKTYFSLDIGLITLTPWRLFTLILSSTFATTLLSLVWFYESPKFLLNAGRHNEALVVMRKIQKWNGLCQTNYPVKKMVLKEMCSLKKEGITLMQSLVEQTVPLFKPPLLKRTLQLYFIISVIYMSNNGFFIWLPYLAETFVSSSSSSSSTQLSNTTNYNDTVSLCSMIRTSQGFQEVNDETVCASPVHIETLWMAMIQGFTFVTCSLIITIMADRRKILLVLILLISCVSGVVSVNLQERILSIIFFFGILLSSLCIGVSFSYFIDLYPTSYRGMASCVGMMVARTSSVVGVNLIGAYVVPYCSATFYLISAFTFSGVIVSLFLPPDRPKKI